MPVANQRKARGSKPRRQGLCPRRRREALTAAQANVRRNWAAAATLLQLCWSYKIDVVLMQEPPTAWEKKLMLCTHPSYELFTPVDSWHDHQTRPRVMTYVRKDPRLQPVADRPAGNTRDILWITVSGCTFVNVYRPPGDSLEPSLDLLLRWRPTTECIVAGDFNASSSTWDPARGNRNRGKEIAQWADTCNLFLLTYPGRPTHDQGGVLDLTFTNASLATAEIDPMLATNSDHRTIRIEVPYPNHATPDCRRITLPDDKLPMFANVVATGASSLPPLAGYGAGSVPPRTSSHITNYLDTAAKALISLLKSALETFGKRPKGKSTGQPWWNDKCATAQRDLAKAIAGGGPFTAEAHALQAAVRAAKRQHWANVLEEADSPEALYRAVKWHKLTPAIRLPPLNIDGEVIVAPKDKAEALGRKILRRFTAEDDLQEDPLHQGAPQGITQLPWDPHVPLEECRKHTIGTANTAPGIDSLSVRLLTATWPAIGEYIRALFEACLRVGHHPSPFRTAEVVMLKKPNKSDMTDPKSYRPIALLSCLGKGLERLVASRMASLALQHGLIAPQHAGATPKKAATDLTACVAHEVERALQNHKAAALVTMDVQGAFDAVLRRRLLQRLLNQGWDPTLVRWVSSFASNRLVHVRLEDATAAPFSPDCGLPQGSPASPVLFMLYMAEILPKAKGVRYGYADDIGICVTGNSPEECSRKAGATVTEILRWGRANKVAFDPGKCELMHFSRQRNPTTPPVTAEGLTIQQAKGSPGNPATLRWLGVFFDQRLNFGPHVNNRVAKALSVANHLRRLTHSVGGIPAHSVHKAVTTVVIPTALYGAEVWYKGKTKPHPYKPAQQQHTRQGHLIERVNKALVTALRAVVPAWKTIPINALHYESGIPGAEALLEQVRLRFAARINTVPEVHPLTAAAKPTLNTRGPRAGLPSKQTTCLQRTAKLVPACTCPAYLPHKYTGLTVATQEKQAAAEAFMTWLNTLSPTDVIIYSDGSKAEDEAVGYGWVIHQAGQRKLSGHGRLAHPAEVFDGEAEGARMGLRKAVWNFPNCTYYLCLDNTSAANGFLSTAPDSSQGAFKEVHCFMDKHQVHVRWSPGHTGIPGNEEADAEAKLGTALPVPQYTKPTVAGIKALARKMSRDARNAWFENNLPERYKDIGLPPIPQRTPDALQLHRKVLQRLIAARTGHGDFNRYHRRFKHEDDNPCRCGKNKSPSHPAFCRLARATENKWPKADPSPALDRPGYWKRLLEKPTLFASFVEVTNYYTIAGR
ncbi:hypothetical protein RB600_001261 [Gaeumannomyces tritici]